MPLISLTPSAVFLPLPSHSFLPCSSLFLLYPSLYFLLWPRHRSVSSLWTLLFSFPPALIYLPPIFPPGDALIPLVHTSSHPLLSVHPTFISFSLHFSRQLLWPLAFFLFSPHTSSWVGCANEVHCTIATKHRILNCPTRNKIKCLIILLWRFTSTKVGL